MTLSPIALDGMKRLLGKHGFRVSKIRSKPAKASGPTWLVEDDAMIDAHIARLKTMVFKTAGVKASLIRNAKRRKTLSLPFRAMICGV